MQCKRQNAWKTVRQIGSIHGVDDGFFACIAGLKSRSFFIIQSAIVMVSASEKEDGTMAGKVNVIWMNKIMAKAIRMIGHAVRFSINCGRKIGLPKSERMI